MAEINCQNCGRKVNGKADLCLFCGKAVRGPKHGNLTGGKKRQFPLGVILAALLLSFLCCVTVTQFGPGQSVLADLLPAQADEEFLDDFEPTVVPTESGPFSTSTPTPIPTLTPTSTPTILPTYKPGTPLPLLPESGGQFEVPFWILGVGGAMLFLGWLWHTWLGRDAQKKSKTSA